MNLGLIPGAARQLAAVGKSVGQATLGSMYTKSTEGFLAGLNARGIGRMAAYMGGGALAGGVSARMNNQSFAKGALVGAGMGLGAGAVASYGFRNYMNRSIFAADQLMTRAPLLPGGNIQGLRQAAMIGMGGLGSMPMWQHGIAAGVGAAGGAFHARRQGKSGFWGAMGGGISAGAGSYGISRAGLAGFKGMFR
jgi:hypothetical protein